MDVDRIKRYKDKIGMMLKRAEQMRSWALDIPADQFLSDDKTKLASYKAFQEMIEAAMDVVAMMCRDSGLVPKDDYSNIESINLRPQTKEVLLEANGLRNRLVHRYNNIDDQIVLDSARVLVPGMEQYAKEVTAWVLKRSSER